MAKSALATFRRVAGGMVTSASGDFLTALKHDRILAIMRGTDTDAVIRASLVLLEAGVRFLEISLVTADAARVINEVVSRAPKGSVVGAGTVLTRDDVARAVDAGAQFMVSPAVAESVVESATRGIAIMAGALTPTEAVTAMAMGATAVKLFPASFGGPGYLRALREPLPMVPFVPVGGVDAALAAEYFAAGASAVGVGSPLVGDSVRGGDLDALAARARSFLAVAQAARDDS
jgi:2-dehydro-3-deoxyphosphogluconate aldolase/(4S)-4-hydroxy-2-oxoglutarate aldolase